MTFPPQMKPGQTASNNQPVGSAGQPNPFASLGSKNSGSAKKKVSDTKSAAIERRMKNLKSKAAKK